MLQINRIREEKEQIIAALAKRHFNAEEIIDELLQTNEAKKQIQRKSEDLKAEANTIAKQIGGLFKEGKREEAEALKSRSGEIKEIGYRSVYQGSPLINGLIIFLIPEFEGNPILLSFLLEANGSC